MYPLSDKDLDRISQEASEQYDVDQRPSGWERLEQRLNKALPIQKEKDRRRFLWIFFLFLLAGGSGLVWMLTGEKEENNVATTNTRSNTKSENATPNTITEPTDRNTAGNDYNNTPKEKNTGPAINKPGNNLPQKNKPASLADNSNTGTEINEPLRSKTAPVTKNKLSRTNLSDTKKEKSNPVNISSNPNQSVRRKAVAPLIAGQSISKAPGNNKPAASVSITNNNDQAEMKDIQQTTIANNTVPPANNTDSAIINQGIPGNKVDEPVNSLPGKTIPAVATTANKKNTGKSAVTSAFALGVITGIDFSRINGTGNSKPGYNIGLQVSYAFSKRWSVNTGFIVTKKNYSAMGDDFNPPKHYWTNYVTLTSLEGDCNMWDIPLNVRYNIRIKPTTTWFVSTGMSSYIMRKQSYTYNYIYNNSPRIREWETSSQQNEWFKMINFSAGFEKTLNRSWSLQAEPFMKLPISGIGFGEMDISSYGILVGIRYKPVFSKNKTTRH